MGKPIYLDNHATTPVDARVVEAMLPYFSERFGNAASGQHALGREAEQAVERARGQIARLIGARAEEIIFTSGATESVNLALKGVAEAYAARGDHIVTVATEHKAVLDTCARLERRGVRVTYLGVKEDGLVDLDELRDAITERTLLVSVMYGNNEIGVIQPVRQIARVARERGVLVHSDATQAVGKIPVHVEEDGIDLMSFSAHKLYGPKGVGALYVRSRNPRVELTAQIDGGGHERGLRSGTLNVPGIVGFGEACAICGREMGEEGRRVGALRDLLWKRLREGLDGVYVHGSLEQRLPNNLNVSFLGVEANALMMAVPEVALSSGSACSSATGGPSHVLRALGVSEDLARGAIRFGLGRFNTEEEIDYAAGRVIEAVRKLRELSPVYEMIKQKAAGVGGAARVSRSVKVARGGKRGSRRPGEL